MLDQLSFQKLVQPMCQAGDVFELLSVFDVLQSEVLQVHSAGIRRDDFVVEEGVLGSEPVGGEFELHEFFALLVLILGIFEDLFLGLGKFVVEQFL